MKLNLKLLALSSALFLAGCATQDTSYQTHEQHFMVGSLESRLNKHGVRLGNPIFLRIFKEEKVLEVWMQANKNEKYKLFGIYPICKNSGYLGPKQFEGDNQAPEGFYAVGQRSLNPNSEFYKSFNLGFPNAYDKAHGYTGSLLMVHGDCVSIGCYAMTDRQIHEIYQLSEAALQHGQAYFRVHIFPFKMTKERLGREKHNRWYSFWSELEQGYNAFEQTRFPPEVEVVNRQYVIKKIHSNLAN